MNNSNLIIVMIMMVITINNKNDGNHHGIWFLEKKFGKTQTHIHLRNFGGRGRG